MGLTDWLKGWSLPGTRYELPPQKDEPGSLTERQAYITPTGEREIWTNEVLYHRLNPEKLCGIVEKLLTGGECREYLQLAEELETILEPHYRTVIGQRKDAVCALPVRIVAASEEKKDQQLAQECRELLLGHDDWAAMLRDLLDGLGKGFAVSEIIWQYRSTNFGMRWAPQAIQRVDPRWLRYYGGDGRTLGLRGAGTLELQPLLRHKWVIHEPHLISAPPVLSGLALPVLFLAMLKRFNLNQWARYVERYGKPTRVGKYPKWATEKGKKTLARAVASVGLSMGVTIPEGMLIEVLEDKGGSRTAQFQNLAQFINKEISKVVLQQTMTTEDGSSRSQSETHNEVRHTMRDSDAMALSRTLRYYLLRSYIELNHVPGTAVPMLEIAQPKAEDLAVLVENVAALVPLGLEVSSAELRERLGLREPKQGEALLQSATQALGATPPPGASLNAAQPLRGLQPQNRKFSRFALAPNAAEPQDAVDHLISEIPDEEYELVADELTSAVPALAKGSSFAEFRSNLAKLAEDSSAWETKSANLADLLALAGFKAWTEGAASTEDGEA